MPATAATEAPILLISRKKSLSVIVEPGEMEYLPGNRRRVTKKPVMIQFDRHKAVVRPDLWRKLGVTREDLLQRLQELAVKGGLFSIDTPPVEESKK